MASLSEEASRSEAAPKQRGLQLNRNLVLGLTLTGVYSFANNIYSTNVFPNFLLEVAGGNTFLFGIAEGLQGLSQLVTAFPIGYLADKYKRKYLLWFGGIVWLIFIALQVYATKEAERDSMRCFLMLCVVLTLGGVNNAIVGGPMMALLDDSVEAGYRSDMELYYSVIWNVSSLAGPIVALVLFYTTKNEWTMDEEKLVIYIGCACTVPCIFISMFLDDAKALGQQSESVLKLGEGKGEPGTAGDIHDDGHKVLGCVTVRMIPWFLFALNLFMAFGAGMTVKFFPIFFSERCKVTPVTLQAVYIALPLVVVCFTVVATKLSKKVGRMQVIIPFTAIGIFFTLAMSLLHDYYEKPHVMIPVYLLRCGFQWSTGGLSYSIIADYVPKEYRARWNTLESIASFGWSGSAVLGGHLVKSQGYSATFAITACVQFFGMAFFGLPILPLVAKESDIQEQVSRLKGGGEGGGEAAEELREPLLGEPHRSDTPAQAIASSSFRGLPGLNPTFEETLGENEHEGASSLPQSVGRSLAHLEHIARAGSLG